MPPEIQKLTQRFLRDPVKVEVARQNSTADTIEQVLLKVGRTPAEKRAALRDQIRAAKDLKNAIIFCNRKRDVATVARSLERHGFDAGALHGDMDQKSRTETLDSFRAGSLAILVASDVAARGLDIPAVSHVFNFDVPTHAEDYVHRIGRTGRAGRSGTAITLIGPGETKYVDAITKLIQRDIAWADASATVSAPAPEVSQGDEAPSSGRKRGRRTRGKDEKPAAERQQPAKPTEQAPRQNREQAPRQNREQPRRANNDDGPASFKSEGHIPAFLLRPTGRA
tara:strand:- start:2148 stop:2993 length:846 start_codon:yes stop_codon:yes gene_type:complete